MARFGTEIGSWLDELPDVLGALAERTRRNRPSPCLGDDMAFEAIDLLLWQADDVDTIAARAKLLAPAIGADTNHLFEWCTAFASMVALELAESSNASHDRVHTYVALAAHAPRA